MVMNVQIGAANSNSFEPIPPSFVDVDDQQLYEIYTDRRGYRRSRR
jgi:hypothetical protein